MKLNSKVFLIPDQFPPQLVEYLREKLKEKNTVINPDDNNTNQLKDITTILFFNRLTGYGLRKLLRKYKGVTKNYLILDTELSDITHHWNKTGYLRFVIKSISQVILGLTAISCSMPSVSLVKPAVI